MPIAERGPLVTMRVLQRKHSVMTRTLALLSLAAVAFASSSCDKHTWKETQVLQEKYSEHGHAGAEHGEAKGEHAAPAAGHEAKPEAHK